MEQKKSKLKMYLLMKVEGNFVSTNRDSICNCNSSVAKGLTTSKIMHVDVL